MFYAFAFHSYLRSKRHRTLLHNLKTSVSQDNRASLPHAFAYIV